MSKKLNEATVTVSINDLTSDNFNAVSDILRLAGVESSRSPVMQPSIATSTEGTPVEPFMSIGEPTLPEPEITTDVNPLDDVVTELTMVQENVVEKDDSEDNKEKDFSTKDEMDAILKLSGNKKVDESSQILPDFDLSEAGASTEMADANKFGAFDSRESAILDAQKQTNGIEGSTFIVFDEDGQFFWKRIVGESVKGEPAPYTDEVDTTGFQNTVHKVEPSVRKNGDNPLLPRDIDAIIREAEKPQDEKVDDVKESEDSDTDNLDDVSTILESITFKWDNF